MTALSIQPPVSEWKKKVWHLMWSCGGLRKLLKVCKCKLLRSKKVIEGMWKGEKCFRSQKFRVWTLISGILVKYCYYRHSQKQNFEFPLLSSKHRLKSASHHAETISVQSTYAALWTEERMFVLLTPNQSFCYNLKALVSCFFYNMHFSTDYK